MRLSDLRDEDANRRMADLLATLIRDLSGNPSIRIHASIAGERKTMSFQLGYAMPRTRLIEEKSFRFVPQGRRHYANFISSHKSKLDKILQERLKPDLYHAVRLRDDAFNNEGRIHCAGLLLAPERIVFESEL